MHSVLKTITWSLLACMLVYGCKKEPGKGGKAEVHLKVIRGDKNIVGAKVQVRYGASSFPGENVTYDETTTTDNYAGCRFESLRKGNYYFYASYTDTLYDTTFYGGIHLRVSDPSEYHTVIDFAEADPF